MKQILTSYPLASQTYPPGEIPACILDECVRFRTQIYIAEGYLPEPEQAAGPDCYDAQSTHFCIRSEDGLLVGYCRMINDSPYTLPITQLYPELEGSALSRVEISRFSLCNRWRGKLNLESMAPVFKLAQELLVFSRQQGIQRWSCLIDERFQKLCQRFFKMEFHLLGKPQIYLGSPSVPCIIDLAESIRNNLHTPGYSTFFGTQELQEWIMELEPHEH